MKIACKSCGKKFKGTRGVAVHVRMKHLVGNISGAADSTTGKRKEKPETVAEMLERFSVNIEGVRIDLEHLDENCDELKRTFGLL